MLLKIKHGTESGNLLYFSKLCELAVMLSRLYISNFALIEEMDVTFPGHLTIITGETGAGKSIFLEGLALALGRRADLNAVRIKDRKCIVEAEFQIEKLGLEDFFKEQGLDLSEK